MYLIHVTKTFDADVERVFEALSDHETLLTVGNAVCRLIDEGSEERDGVGAVREIRVGSAVRFEEAIPAFDRPRSYDYRIRTLKVLGVPFPAKHERGWLEFHDEGGSTRVEWRSRFRITLPIIGPRLDPFLGRVFEREFGRIMKAAARRLASSSPSRGDVAGARAAVVDGS